VRVSASVRCKTGAGDRRQCHCQNLPALCQLDG
jgi:hypothetical protein